MSDTNLKFDCPVCKSKRRFFEQLASDAKLYGVALANFAMGLNSIQGPCADKRVQPKPGSKVPMFQVITDICLDCGCVYAAILISKTAHVSIQTAKELPKGLILPNETNKN
jgi:hypothetical protein